MRTRGFLRKVVVPVAAAVFLTALFYPLCVENGVCDYLKQKFFCKKTVEYINGKK